MNLIENRPVKLRILFYDNADETDLLRTSWSNLDPILKSLLHALNIVFYFANEATNVAVHCVGKYKLVPVSKNAESWFMDKRCQLKNRILYIGNISVYSNRDVKKSQ